jgi:hypothetical protein
MLDAARCVENIWPQRSTLAAAFTFCRRSKRQTSTMDGLTPRCYTTKNPLRDGPIQSITARASSTLRATPPQSRTMGQAAKKGKLPLSSPAATTTTTSWATTTTTATRSPSRTQWATLH